MAKVKETYELMVIFNTKLGEEGIKELVEKFKERIERHATLNSVDEWGKRKLAYPINYETEGYYMVVNFTSEEDFPAELDRVINITDGVLRTLIVAKGE